jgi:hypothetical protein
MSNGSDLLVGLFAAALVPIIALRIIRGLREGRLPVYRTQLTREEDAGKFRMLLALHGASLVLVGAIAADLLFKLGLREAL